MMHIYIDISTNKKTLLSFMYSEYARGNMSTFIIPYVYHQHKKLFNL